MQIERVGSEEREEEANLSQSVAHFQSIRGIGRQWQVSVRALPTPPVISRAICTSPQPNN